MSRLPPFVRKTAPTTIATATAAEPATAGLRRSESSECSSSNPTTESRQPLFDVARIAAVAVASAADRFSGPPSVEAQRWRDLFEERAAIIEFDAGLSRAEAEAGALADLATRWRCENPLPANDASACAHCGGQKPDTPVLAAAGHAWLHRECWVTMHAARQRLAEQAVQALLEAAP